MTAVARPDLLRTVADTLPELTYDTWGFGDSVAFEAMVAASANLGEDRWLAFARGWIRAWATRALPYRRLDCTAPGAAMVAVHRATGDPNVLEAACRLADWLLTRPTLAGVHLTWEHSPLMHPYGPSALDAPGAALIADPPPGVFLDCLHFDPPFLVALGAAAGASRYTRAGVDQALGYLRLLQRDDGFLDHFVLQGETGRFGPGWGRGQGWALLGLLEVLETLGHGSTADDAAVTPEERGVLGDAARVLVRAMLACQRDDGHWYAVVTDPSSGDEFSTAAFMATGFRRAVRHGLFDDTEASRVELGAARALAAAVAGTDADGGLREVSAAVMACTEPSHYAHVPRGFRVPWGQGPLVLALCEDRR